MMTPQEFCDHVRRLEEKLERFVARENPSRAELLEWIRSEFSARVMVTELNVSGDEVAEIVTSTPLF
jgi:hypothetical protein